MAHRVGIVGVGGIAHCHGRAAREAPEAVLAAICDVSEEALDRFGGAFDVSGRYTDLERMLHEEEIDILSVCTWGNSHADIAIRAARSGRVRAILCEKPISSTAAECEAMIKAAREHGVLLAEAFKFRHHPCHLRAKELIDAGEIGKVMFIRSTFTAAVDPGNLRPDYNWRFNRDKRGGATYDLGCYCIHHARFITGSEPERVHARGHYGTRSRVPESVLAQLEFPDEISAQCAFSFRFYGSQEFEVYGTDGYMRMDMAWNNEDHPVALEIRKNDGEERTVRFAPVFQFTDQLRHLCDCLESGRPHRIPPENSLGNMRVIDAVHASIDAGQPVVLNPV